MNDTDIDFIVKKTVRQMINEQWDMIPGQISQEVSDNIRETIESTMETRFNIPYGRYYIGCGIKLIPNGTIDVSLSDVNNWDFWRGILRPPSHS